MASTLSPATSRAFAAPRLIVPELPALTEMLRPDAGERAPLNVTLPIAEPAEATVTIHEGQLSVEDGLLNKPNLKIIADSETWLGILAGERNLLWALITRRVRLQGNPKWLLAFKRCFPS